MWQNLNKIIESEHEIIFSGEIFGHLPSGKNNYRISGGRLFRNIKITIYEHSFMPQIYLLKTKNKCIKPISCDVIIAAQIWFKDHRRDVDTILFCDLLQKYGIIENDRQIKMKLINGMEIDKKDPRIDFKLYRL